MTEVREHTFPFAPADAPTAPGAEQAPAGTSRNRIILVVGLLVGLLVIGGGAYVLFLSGGDSSSTGGTSSVTKVPSKPKAVTPAKPVTKPVPRKATNTYTAPVGKDPFKPLVVEAPAAAAAPVGGTATAPTGTTSGTTTGTTTTAPSTPATVKLVTVSTANTSATLTVGSHTYTASLGATFGQYFKVLALTDGRCGTFAYGDTSFQMCEGQTTRVS